MGGKSGKHRTVYKGINIGGYCSRCKFNVIVPLGMLKASQDVCITPLKCPRSDCQKSSLNEDDRGFVPMPTRVLIRNCTYSITGKVKTKNGAISPYSASGQHTISESSPWFVWDNKDGVHILKNYCRLCFECS